MSTPRRSVRGLALVACAMLVGCTARTAGDETSATEASGDPSDVDEASSHDGNEGSTSDDEVGDFPDDGGEFGEEFGGECGSFLGCEDTPIDHCRTKRTSSIDQCDFESQDCPQAEKCTWIASTPGSIRPDAHVCVPEGSGGRGATCALADGPQGTDTCGGIGVCLMPIGETNGTCTELCSFRPDQPECLGADEVCVDVNGGPYLQTGVCGQACDPRARCSPTRRCVPSTTVTDPGGCVIEQVEPQAGVGDLCDTHLGCAQGQACLDADIVGPGCDDCRCCTELCTVGEPDTCSGPGQTCRPAHNPDYPTLGYCGAA